MKHACYALILCCLLLAGAARAENTPIPATPADSSAPVVPAVPVASVQLTGVPQFAYTAADIQKLASGVREVLDQKLAELVKIPADKRTFENTPLALEYAFSDFNNLVTIPQLLAYVSTDKEIRDAANKLEEVCNEYMVEVAARKDLYNAVKEFQKTSPKLAVEDQFLLDRTMLDFKRMGLELPDKDLEEYKEMKKKLVSLELKFAVNIREYKDHIEVTKDELAGLPEDYISKLNKTPEGKFIVSMDYPEYTPFMDNAQNENARKQIELKFNSRAGKDNVGLFEEALELRDKLAKKLGYKNHSEYMLADRMAKHPDIAISFLDNLRLKLRSKAEAEMKSRLELKAAETKAAIETEMGNWNWRYWNNMFRKKNLELDSEIVKEYFPMETVVAETFKIMEELFEVKFQKAQIPTWHEDVIPYEVKEKDGALIGYFYLDLFPREGKYKHMACFGIVKGRALPDGSYRKPCCAIIGNFPKPSKDSPSLFSHNDVETFFHEFGHVSHQLFTRNKYESFSGTSVARDFVEVPSTILENWVWQPEVLKRVSNHYKTGEKLPDELIKKMIANKNFDAGMVQSRQIFFSLYDLRVHTTDLKDTTNLYKTMMKEIQLVPMTENAIPQASFGHLMGGYDSGYYGYLWARAIASDLFTEFAKNGLFDPKTGKKFRDLILAVGRTPDPAVDVENFLGRKFTEEALAKSFGLE